MHQLLINEVIRMSNIGLIKQIMQCNFVPQRKPMYWNYHMRNFT